jgi:uncharacterized membrane protein
MLVRRGAYPEAFMWWLSVVAAVIYLPLGAYLFARHGVSADGWPFVVATIAIHALYFVLLGRAYEHGDLSLVYPIARGTGPLLAVGVTIAVYSVVDKVGVGLVEPVLYTYLIFPGSVVLAGPYFWARSRAAVVGSWRENRRSLLLAGALAPASYGLALSAFRLGQVSYLAPMREVSIVVAALLGAVVLREELTRARLASVVVTAAGVVLIGLGA